MAGRTFLNHVEMVYRPGDEEAAREFFELLGFAVQFTPPWLTVGVEPTEADNWADNVLYAQPAIPAQEKFEAELARVIESDERLAAALNRYKEVRRNHPQVCYHWGVHIPTHEDWEQRVARVQEAAKSHPLLKGRVEVMVFEAGKNPHAISTQSQAFVRTDVLVAEGYPFGLEIELQYTPLDENGKSNAQATGFFPPAEALA